MTELTETEIASVDGAIQEWENHGGPIINHLLPAVAHIKAAARAKGERDMRGKIEALIAKAESGAEAWGACAHEWARIDDLRALLADGGEPQ